MDIVNDLIILMQDTRYLLDIIRIILSRYSRCKIQVHNISKPKHYFILNVLPFNMEINLVSLSLGNNVQVNNFYTRFIPNLANMFQVSRVCNFLNLLNLNKFLANKVYNKYFLQCPNNDLQDITYMNFMITSLEIFLFHTFQTQLNHYYHNNCQLDKVNKQVSPLNFNIYQFDIVNSYLNLQQGTCYLLDNFYRLSFLFHLNIFLNYINQGSSFHYKGIRYLVGIIYNFSFLVHLNIFLNYIKYGSSFHMKGIRYLLDTIYKVLS